jgi:hypothetical protein
VTICRDAGEITEIDVGEKPLDLVFFDCHAYAAQMEVHRRLSQSGIITDRTVLVLHDNNLLPSRFVASYPVEDGWRHIEVEPRMVNEFKKMGYDIFCLHTEMSVHSEELPYRWGLTIARRFKPLVVRD